MALSRPSAPYPTTRAPKPGVRGSKHLAKRVNSVYDVPVLYPPGTLADIGTAIAVLGLFELLVKRVTATIRAGRVLLTELRKKSQQICGQSIFRISRDCG